MHLVALLEAEPFSRACEMDGEFEIDIFKMSGGMLTKVSVCSSLDVAWLKNEIAKASGVPAARQRLLVGNDQLLDDTQLLQDTTLLTQPQVYLIDIGIEGQLGAEGVATYAGTCVAEAAQLGALGDVLRLVEAGADINSKHDYGYTALHHMAAVPGATGGAYDEMRPEAAAVMLKWLIEHGANVNMGDNGGKTPLHVFGKYGGSLDQLNVLLEAGADVNQPMSYGDGWTPLWYCRNYKRPLWKEAEAVLEARGAMQRPAALD